MAEHGTRTRYSAGCRCGNCTTANSVFQRQRAHAGRVPRTHGLSGYINYGCRCIVCTEANKTKCREYQANRRISGRVLTGK